MPLVRLPMTKRQLVECFQDYRRAFPDWSVEHHVVLARYFGPVRQVIAFEVLRAGSYRPSCSIDVLTTPQFQLLYSFLDIRHRQVDPRRHTEKWPVLVKAMEDQFRPSIREPLSVEEIVRLGEQEVTDAKAGNSQYCAGLASLNAWMGNSERALYWCEKIDQHLSAPPYPLAEWENEVGRFVRSLRDAIATDRVQSLFEPAAQ